MSILRTLARRVAVEWRHFDATCLRNHFCFDCDRQTWRQHNHHDARLITEIRELLEQEWRA